MNIFKLVLELFVIYMVYKLVFDLIIPVYRTTKQVRRKMSEMQQHMQEQNDLQNQQFKSNPGKTGPSSRSYSDDYIEYEEIK